MDERYDIRRWIERQIQQQLNWHSPLPTETERRRIFNELLLGLHGEVGELQERLHAGPHILRSLPIEASAIAHDVVDALKYILAIAVTAGVTPELLADTFWSVTDAVDDRWRCERVALEGELVLVVDIDGCLADFNDGFQAWYSEQTGGESFRPEADLNTHQMEPYKQRFYAEGGFAELEPLPGAANIVREAQMRGCRVVVITARPKHRHKNVETDTIQWLRRHRIPYDLLLFNRDKAEALSEHVLPARVFAAIEDRHKHAIEIAALGIPVILFPSSVDVGTPPSGPLIHSVKDWWEARGEIAHLYGPKEKRNIHGGAP